MLSTNCNNILISNTLLPILLNNLPFATRENISLPCFLSILPGGGLILALLDIGFNDAPAHFYLGYCL